MLMKETRDIQTQIKTHLSHDGQLTCAAAHHIATELKVEPLAVGEEATAMGIRITRCQLGFFGFAERKGLPGYKIVQELEQVPGAAAGAVCRAAEGGKTTCAALWEIGKAHKLSKLDMGNISQTMEIKTHSCQLGCF